MQIIKEIFTDFDVYNAAVDSWKLEYNILSKQDFNARVNLFSDDNFELGRISLQGKLKHSGNAPIGYRTFVIPINSKDRFIWFNKGTNGNELLVFPKNCQLNAVTFNNFDAFIVSIENNFLEQIIQENNFNRCKRIILKESEQEFLLSKSFAKEFYVLANHFLTKHIKSTDFSKININTHNELVDNIIDKLLKFIDNAKQKTPPSYKNKRYLAIKEAIDFIHNNSENIFSVKELSIISNVSERTLLYGFKDMFNTSPKKYIKAFRLNKVKNELFCLQNKNIHISTIAGKYNFWHMGQFAKDFKNQFGILPSDFLNNLPFSKSDDF